jgi:hypothetical protein
MKKDFCFPLQYMVLIVTMYSGCSEFNRPVAPGTFFAQYAKDSISGISIKLIQNGTVANINCGRYGFGSMNAKFFLKERKENEFITTPLPSLSVDLWADLYFEEKFIGSDHMLSSDIDYFDKNGKKVCESGNFDAKRWVMMSFEDLDAVSHIQVYFWQIEFYVSGDTVRLPEKPGIWCINPDL